VCVCEHNLKINTVTDRPAVLTDWTIRVIDNLANSQHALQEATKLSVFFSELLPVPPFPQKEKIAVW